LNKTSLLLFAYSQISEAPSSLDDDTQNVFRFSYLLCFFFYRF